MPDIQVLGYIGHKGVHLFPKKDIASCRQVMPGKMTRGYEFSFESITSPDHYVELGVIGNGAYGTVYKAHHKVHIEKIVALKKVRILLTEEGIPMSTIREIALLRQIDQYEHPNIIRLLDTCHGSRLVKEQQIVLYLVFEHVDQDLATYMEKCPPPGLPAVTIKNLMHQILCGVDFLHSHRILHRDLKPQNLLITNTGNIKLADFGLAKTYDFEMRLTTVVVTLWYRSPEVLLGSRYATPVDVWSAGCIMAEMFTSSPFFSGTSEGDQLDRIFRVIGTPKEMEWPEDVSIAWSSFYPSQPVDLKSCIPDICEEGKDLLRRMLQFDPRVRISTVDALRHKYFADSTYEVPKLKFPCENSNNNSNNRNN